MYDVGSSHPGGGENHLPSLSHGNMRVINEPKTVKAFSGFIIVMRFADTQVPGIMISI
jgi:hypothetical protein